MSECSLIAECAKFYGSLANMPSTAKLMKGAYCGGHYAECARFIVYTVHGRKNIPLDLYPSDTKRITELVS